MGVIFGEKRDLWGMPFGGIYSFTTARTGGTVWRVSLQVANQTYRSGSHFLGFKRRF